MPLIIHVGHHKTGSTAIQAFLERNREQLRSHEIVVPQGLSSWLGHPELSWVFAAEQYPWQDKAYQRDEVLSHYRPSLDQSLDPDQLIIISSEEFSRLQYSPESMASLKQAFAPYDPIIVGFSREPLAFLLSRYRHEVQNGGEFRSLRSFLGDPENVVSADFTSGSAGWPDVFPGSTVFRRYETCVRQFGSIVTAFLHILGKQEELAALGAERDSESKLHPTFLDAYRFILQSSLNDATKEAFCRQMFEISDQLPDIKGDALVSLLGSLPDTLLALLSPAQIPGDDDAEATAVRMIEHRRAEARDRNLRH